MAKPVRIDPVNSSKRRALVPSIDRTHYLAEGAPIALLWLGAPRDMLIHLQGKGVRALPSPLLLLQPIRSNRIGALTSAKGRSRNIPRQVNNSH